MSCLLNDHWQFRRSWLSRNMNPETGTWKESENTVLSRRSTQKTFMTSVSVWMTFLPCLKGLPWPCVGLLGTLELVESATDCLHRLSVWFPTWALADTSDWYGGGACAALAWEPALPPPPGEQGGETLDGAWQEGSGDLSTVQ